MGKEKVDMMVCDNPDCLTMREAETDGQTEGIYIPRAFVGTGVGGAALKNLYACSLICMAPALSALMKEAYSGSRD